jgi:hypothetical protein
VYAIRLIARHEKLVALGADATGPRSSYEREAEGLRVRSTTLIWPPAPVSLHLFSHRPLPCEPR